MDYGGFVVGEAEAEARLLGKSEVNPLAYPALHDSRHLTERHACRVSWPASPSSTKSFASSTASKLSLDPPSHGPFDCKADTRLPPRVEWHVQEGDALKPVQHCATVRGPVRKILLGERVALNTLARCSGIATQ